MLYFHFHHQPIMGKMVHPSLCLVFTVTAADSLETQYTHRLKMHSILLACICCTQNSKSRLNTHTHTYWMKESVWGQLDTARVILVFAGDAGTKCIRAQWVDVLSLSFLSVTQSLTCHTWLTSYKLTNSHTLHKVFKQLYLQIQVASTFVLTRGCFLAEGNSQNSHFTVSANGFDKRPSNERSRQWWRETVREKQREKYITNLGLMERQHLNALEHPSGSCETRPCFLF